MSERLFPRASRLGFGCASLGSRVPAKKGLEALARAFDAGVNWFDLAPAYGDGSAETIFSAFAKGRRDRIHICTKYGIAPATSGGIARLLRPLAQRAVAAAPALRRFAARGRVPSRPLPLAASDIREGLERSLKRLGTDTVDVYTLHDPDPHALDRDEVRQAIEDVMHSGKARAVGIAGSVEAALAGLRAGLAIQQVQVPDPPFADAPGKLAARTPRGAHAFLVTHSVFGRIDPLDALLARAKSPGALRALLAAHGYDQPLDKAARAVIFDRALAANTDGVVLLSMFSGRHLAENMARLEHDQSEQAEALFRELIGSTDASLHPGIRTLNG